MTELHIKTLTCVKKQDTAGKDSAVLSIGGRTIGARLLMAKGDTQSLSITEPFTNSVQVTLTELDAGADDNLGTVTVEDTTHPAGHARRGARAIELGTNMCSIIVSGAL